MSKAHNKKKMLFLCLRIVVVAAGIGWATWWIIKEHKWPELSRLFSQMSLPLFLLVLLVFILSQIVVAFRWWLILRSQNIKIDLWAAIMLNFIGLYYNNFLPGAVGGDLIRAWFVTRHTEKKFEAVLSVFVDRVLGFISMIILAVIAWMVFLKGQSLYIQGFDIWKLLAKYRDVLLVLLAAAAVIMSVLLLSRGTRRIAVDFCKRLEAKIIEHFKKAWHAFVLYCSSPFTIFAALGITIISQAVLIFFFALLCENLGVEGKLRYFFIFFPASWVLGALPVSIGGAVLVEGVLFFLFTKYAGVTESQALAIALLQRPIWWLAAIPGAVIHLSGAHLPKDFSIDYKEPVN